MSKKANPAIVGGFVVGAIVLIVGTIMLFGSGRLFRDIDSFVAFFDGSLKGLDVGAPVTFRGVRIGTVTEILSVYDLDKDEIYFPVILEIDGDHFIDVGDPNTLGIDTNDEDAVMKHLYDKGMRAKLEMRSFVTGQINVDVDIYPDAPLILRKHSFPKGYMEFPTIPSDVQRILNSIQRIVNKFEDVDIDTAIERVQNILEGIDELVNSPELDSAVSGIDDLVNSEELKASLESLHSAMDSFDAAMVSAKRVIDNAEDEIGPVVAQLRESASRMGQVLDQTQGLLNELQKGIGEDSELRVHTTTAMDELAKAARSMRVLSDYLQTHPESLIKGKR